jgi:tetratricopeptide (TPR) repeat protein
MADRFSLPPLLSSPNKNNKSNDNYHDEEHLRRHLLRSEKQHGPDHPKTIAILLDLASSSSNNDHLNEASSLYTRAVEVSRRSLGPNHAATLAVSLKLAQVLQRQGTLDAAEPLFRHVLVSTTQILGAQNKKVLRMLNNLGKIQQQRGHLSDAEDLFRRALSGCEKVFKSNHPNTLSTVHNLGSVLIARKQLDVALPLYRRVVQSIEQKLKGTFIFDDDPRLQLSLIHLGRLLQKLNQIPEADEILCRVLFSRQRALGMNHRLTLHSVRLCSQLYLQTGEDTKAEPLLLRLLSNNTAVLPKVDDMLQLGDVYCRLNNNYQKAEQMYRRALTILNSLKEETHSEKRLHVLQKLTVVLEEMKSYDECEHWLRYILQQREDIQNRNSSDHSKIIFAVTKLGQFLTKMKKDEEAEILLRRAMVFYEKKYLSTNHPHLTKSIEDLGLLLLQTKQFHECEILFKKVVAAEIISYGLDSIDTYLAMTNEGKLKEAEGKLYKAELIYRTVVERSDIFFKKERKKQQKQNKHTCIFVQNLASLLLKRGCDNEELDNKYLAEAHTLYLRVLQVLQVLQGIDCSEDENDDLPTLAVIDRLGEVCQKRGLLKAAEQYCRRSLAGYERIVGHDHPSMVSCLMSLASVLHDCSAKMNDESPNSGFQYCEESELLLRASLQVSQRLSMDR